MEMGKFLYLFLIGFIEGIFLSSLSTFAFETFVSHSLVGYLILLCVLLILLASFWMVPKFVGSNLGIRDVRVMLVGIGIASFYMLLFSLVVLSRTAESGGWVLLMSDESPYIRIMGVPFSTIVWTLFLGSFFTALERILKVWEEYRK